MREYICNRIDKVLVSKIHKQLMQIHIKKKPKQLKLKMRGWSNRHFSKEHVHVSKRHMKRCSTPLIIQFTSIQFSRSVVSDSATPWIAARQASLSITNSRSSHKLMPIESVMPSSHLILCHPLLHLPSIPPSISVFSNESTLRMRWPKYWSFSFSISTSNEHPGLISFRMDWLDLLAVQRTLKSLL